MQLSISSYCLLISYSNLYNHLVGNKINILTLEQQILL